MSNYQVLTNRLNNRLKIFFNNYAKTNFLLLSCIPSCGRSVVEGFLFFLLAAAVARFYVRLYSDVPNAHHFSPLWRTIKCSAKLISLSSSPPLRLLCFSLVFILGVFKNASHYSLIERNHPELARA